jgi:hypothetical protein
VGIRPLNRVPIPVTGENAYGYVRRFAACLGYEKIDPFRHAMKLREFGPTSETWRWERLAALAGFPVEALLHMRWRDPDAGKDRSTVSFLGQPLRSTHLSFSRMRFCPTCLKDDGPPEQRLLRDHWALLMAPVCVRHGTLLVDTCDECGDPFEFRRKTGVWACGCGREMVDVVTRPASPGASGVTMALHLRLGVAGATGHVNLSKAGLLPAVFHEMPLNDLASIVDRVGVVAATPASEDDPVDDDRLNYRTGRIDQDRSIAECARQIEHAYAILRDWPVGFERLIADVAGRNPAPTTEHKVRRLFATRMGRLLLDPLRGVDGRPIGLLDGVLREWLRREHGYRWGQRVDEPKRAEAKRILKSIGRADVTNPPPVRFTRLQNRVRRLQTNDAFMQAHKLGRLLDELWPGTKTVDPAVDTGIRVEQKVRIYGTRKFPQNAYSVRDAIAEMSRRHGTSSLM